MQSFTEEIYQVENKARKYIYDKLDEVGSIEMFDPKELDIDVERSEEIEDAFTNLTGQH